MDTPATPTPTAGQEEKLCLACGLCCNGVLFKDVELQETDDPVALNHLGLPLRVRKTQTSSRSGADTTITFPQPCTALLGCRCTIYAQRPARCHQYDCSLLLQFRTGTITDAQALQRIQDTRSAALSVLKLLATLGDADTSRALSLRFQRLRHRVERAGLDDEEMADLYGQLTLAVHDLQRRLQQSFYP